MLQCDNVYLSSLPLFLSLFNRQGVGWNIDILPRKQENLVPILYISITGI